MVRSIYQKGNAVGDMFTEVTFYSYGLVGYMSSTDQFVALFFEYLELIEFLSQEKEEIVDCFAI